MEGKLYNASLEGSVESLHALMQEDKLTLARVSVTCFNETPLHVAAMLGHLDFVRALLDYKPDLFVRLDSEGRSPLHLASANGFIEIVRLLLTADPEVCLIRDEERRTPLYLAIMNGQIDVVKELVKVKPKATMYTDVIGNTILHTATALKRVQIVKYLLNINEVKVNAVNRNGFTALNIIENMPKDVKAMEIKELLISTGARRANDLTELPSATTGQVTGAVVDNNNQISPPANVESPAASRYNNIKKCLKKKPNIIMKKFRIFMKKNRLVVEKKDDALLIAASVIAAMAYQAILSPPGGLIGKEEKESPTSEIAPMAYQSPLSPPGGVIREEVIVAGTTILANSEPLINSIFWLFNTISFIASLSIIFLFTSGLPINRRIFIWLLRAAMWVTVSSMALAYIESLIAITRPSARQRSMYHIINNALSAWLGLIGITFLVLDHLPLDLACSGKM